MWLMLPARRSASLRRGASSELEKSTLSQTSISAGRVWRQPSNSGWSEITGIGIAVPRAGAGLRRRTTLTLTVCAQKGVCLVA